MDVAMAARVAERTLDIALVRKDGAPGSAIRFKHKGDAVSYAWTNERARLYPVLDALREQLAGYIKDWELIQGGKSDKHTTTGSSVNDFGVKYSAAYSASTDQAPPSN